VGVTNRKEGEGGRERKGEKNSILFSLFSPRSSPLLLSLLAFLSRPSCDFIFKRRSTKKRRKKERKGELDLFVSISLALSLPL
jgi:hypothetical protein